jgi:hypothetical protein
MRVFIYILTTCLLLFWGHGETFAYPHDSGTAHFSVPYTKSQGTQRTSHHHHLSKKILTPEVEKDLTSVESEDTDIAFNRKYTLLPSYYLALSYTLLYNQAYHISERLPSFSFRPVYPAPDIYILQRTLRI